MAWRENLDLIALLVAAGVANALGLYSLPVLGPFLLGLTVAFGFSALVPLAERLGLSEKAKRWLQAAALFAVFAAASTLLVTPFKVAGISEVYAQYLVALGYLLAAILGLVAALVNALEHLK